MIYLILIVLIASVYVTVLGLLQYRRYVSMKKWPRVAIEIIESKIRTLKVSAVYVYIDYFVLDISYKYTLDGAVYNGRSVFFDEKAGMFTDKLLAANSLKEILKAGVAYINPNNATDTVLSLSIPNYRMSHYRSLLAFGVLLLAFGLFFGVVYIV